MRADEVFAFLDDLRKICRYGTTQLIWKHDRYAAHDTTKVGSHGRQTGSWLRHLPQLPIVQLAATESRAAR